MLPHWNYRRSRQYHHYHFLLSNDLLFRLTQRFYKRKAMWLKKICKQYINYQQKFYQFLSIVVFHTYNLFLSFFFALIYRNFRFNYGKSLLICFLQLYFQLHLPSVFLSKVHYGIPLTTIWWWNWNRHWISAKFQLFLLYFHAFLLLLLQ